MNKHGLMFALAFCLWLWQYIAMRRLTLKKLRDRENNKKIRQRFDILQERLKSKTKSVEKKGWNRYSYLIVLDNYLTEKK